MLLMLYASESICGSVFHIDMYFASQPIVFYAWMTSFKKKKKHAFPNHLSVCCKIKYNHKISFKKIQKKKMFSGVELTNVKTKNCFPGGLWVSRQFGLNFLWLYELWVFLVLLHTLFMGQKKERTHRNGRILPLKRQPRWTFDIPLAQHHSSTSPHISLCCSDNTMWLDWNSPLNWLCWHTLPPITHPSLIQNYTWMHLRYQALPLIKCTD